LIQMNTYSSDIESCLDTLATGGTLIYPTDTIWGIGCDSTVESAVEKIHRMKKRDHFQSMLILASDIQMVKNYVSQIPDEAVDLMTKSTGPVTLIYPNAKNLAGKLIAKDGSIGIRIPSDEFCLELIRQLGKPIVSTSANFTGKPFPANFSEIDPELLKTADYVSKWRQEERGTAVPSSIYKIEPGGKVLTISR
jgi:L-threonylcarbamoyladenylate synthase